MTPNASRLLPALLTASVLAAAAALAAGSESPVRTALVLWFLLVCPGAALVINLRLRQGWAEAAVAVGLSIAIDTVVAGALFYLGIWSPALGFTLLAVLSLSGAAVAAVRSRVTEGIA